MKKIFGAVAIILTSFGAVHADNKTPQGQAAPARNQSVGGQQAITGTAPGASGGSAGNQSSGRTNQNSQGQATSVAPNSSTGGGDKAASAKGGTDWVITFPRSETSK